MYYKIHLLFIMISSQLTVLLIRFRKQFEIEFALRIPSSVSQTVLLLSSELLWYNSVSQQPGCVSQLQLFRQGSTLME